MAILNKSAYDTKYNSSGSGSFLNNTTKQITPTAMRGYAKDNEDSLGFLNDINAWTQPNTFSKYSNWIGYDTSTSVSEIGIYRTGSPSYTAGNGPNISLNNTTSSKNVMIMGVDDTMSIQNYNFGWIERLRMNSSGMFNFGNTGDTAAVANASITGIKVHQTTADNSIFHIAGFFQQNQSVSGTNSLQGVEGYVKTTHTSGTITLAIGAIGNFELGGAGGTVGIARSIQAGGNLTAAGTVTEWDGVYVNFANSGGSTITSAYVLYGDTFPSGVTNKYGVCIAETTAKSGFGVTSPTAMVDLLGSTTSIASLRIRSGTAPSSPNDGDIWYDGTNIKIRVGGSTKTFTIV